MIAGLAGFAKRILRQTHGPGLAYNVQRAVNLLYEEAHMKNGILHPWAVKAKGVA